MFWGRRRPVPTSGVPSPTPPDGTRQLDEWLRHEGLDSDDDPPPTSIPRVGYDDSDPNRVWHLALLQGTINRMSTLASKQITYSLTVMVGVITFLAHRGFPEGKTVVLTILAAFGALLAELALWCRHAYYLQQERLYRALFEEVRNHNPNIESFSMDTRHVLPAGWGARRFGRLSWFGAFRSKTVLQLHVVVVVFLSGLLLYLICTTDILQRIGNMFPAT